MASIFSLYGQIFVDNEKANKAIDETTKKGKDSSSSFAENFGNVTKKAMQIGTAVVGATTAVVGGITAMASNVADTAGSIDDAAKKVGTSVEEYQKWAYAANLGGLESSKLESLMVKQQKAFSDAKEGSAAMSEAYKRLGIDISNISNSGDAFNEVIAKLADMEDATERNAIANDIFGKSYADLTPLLEEGSEGIAAWKQEAEDLGGVLSQDAITAGADFGDMMDRVKTSLSGAFNNIVSQLFPVLQQFLDLILQNMPTIQSLISSLAPILVNLLSGILPPFIQLSQTILPIIVQLINQLLPFITTIIETILPVIINLINLLLPPIMQIVELVLPLLISLIEPLLPLLQPIFDLLQPFIDLLMALIVPLLDIVDVILPPLINLFSTLIKNILPPLQACLSGVASVLSGVFGGALDLIKNQIGLVIDNFKNIISFVKNVFTGNWKGAWDNVKNIFKNFASGLGNIFKAPINFIIDGINAFLKGLNKLKIPDWVPGVGGKGLNIPLIKKLRVGIENVPYDEMPALLHKGEAVLTAEQAKEYRNQEPIKEEIQNNYYHTIHIDKVEVREERDIKRIAEELYYLQQKREV